MPREELTSRMQRIQAAIQRGASAKEIRRKDPRRLTVEEEQQLNAILLKPDGDGLIDIDLEDELAAQAREYRISRVLEFCPDGSLAHRILGEMVSNGTVPGARSWTAVIEAFGGRNALDGALDVFRDMQQAGVAPTGATYGALARPAMRRGEFKFVEALCRAKASDCGGLLGVEFLEILLETYANSWPPQPERAIAAFRRELAAAQEEGIPATVLASEAVLRGLRRLLGLNQTSELCWEYGVDPVGML